MLKIDIIISLKIKKMKKEHMVKINITCPLNNFKNIKNNKKIIKKYIVKRKNKSYKTVKTNKVILTKMQSGPLQKHNGVLTLSKYYVCFINYCISTLFIYLFTFFIKNIRSIYYLYYIIFTYF